MPPRCMRMKTEYSIIEEENKKLDLLYLTLYLNIVYLAHV